MLEILQARLQQYVNHELPDVQAGFRKGRGTRDQIANIRWIMEKPREFQENIYFCFIDYTKAFDCVDHNKWWKILQEMGIPDHLTCLLKVKVKVKSLSRVQLFETPWTVAYQDPPLWDFPGKSAGVDCHFFLQGIFLTQESKPGLPHRRQTL